MMKRFIIHVETNWCGMWEDFRAVAEKESDLYDTAEDLSYDNYESHGCAEYVAEEQGYEVSEMTDSDWSRLWEDVYEGDYYSYSIEEFTGTDEEWEEFGGYVFNEGKCI